MRDLTGYVLDGRYVFTKRIASGGSSVVYIAQDAAGNLKKEWAVKCVDGGGDKTYLDNYKQEVALLDELNHPNIVNIIYYSEHEGCFFFVMDFINGDTLEEVIEKNERISEKEAAELALTLCSVLHYLHTVHDLPIIYSDLKPKNIIIDNHGIPFILDLGIAHEVIPGQIDTSPPIGSKGYAAPEQFAHSTRLVDERTDVYALGAVLFKMVTGQTPKCEKYIPGKKIVKKNNIHKLDPNISTGMSHIISKCMEPNPDKRYQSIEEVREDLIDINLLNEQYINKIKKRLTWLYVFGISILVGLLLMVSGYAMILHTENTAIAKYTNQAQSYVLSGDIASAKDSYLNALAINNDNISVIIEMYDSLYNANSDSDLNAAQEALDAVRTNTNIKALIKNPSFAMRIARDAIGMNTTVYSDYAKELLSELKKTREYKKGEFNNAVVDALYLISQSSSDTKTSEENIKSSVNELLAATDDSDLSDAEKVNNYYIVLMIYSAFPDYFNDVNEYLETADKAGKILDKNNTNDNFSFSKKVSLCESVANQMYVYAVNQTDSNKKRNYLETSYSWYKRLGELPLEIDGYIGKGDVCNELSLYSEAKACYLKALNIQSNNRLALIGITRSCIREKNYTEARNYYNTLLNLGTDNLSQSALNQLESLQIEINGI